jgi:UDP-sugar diphosphatase
VTGTKQAFYYAQVTNEMRVTAGGSNVEEGEMIEVVEIPVKDSMQFAMDQSKEKPVGMIFAILWYHQNKASKQL